MLWTHWRHGTHTRTLADTCLLLRTPECAGLSLTLDGLSPTLSYLRSLSRPTSMAPSDSPSEPLGALGRFMARAGSGVSALRSVQLVGGPRPSPAPAREPTPPFPRALSCTAAQSAPAPPRPRGDAPPNRGKAPGGHRPHRPLGGPAPLHRRCLDWRAGWPWAGALGGPTGEAQTDSGSVPSLCATGFALQCLSFGRERSAPSCSMGSRADR